MSKFAIVCAAGIGDALILSIASHHLQKQGHSVITFSPHLAGFGAWLPDSPSLPPVLENWAETLRSFDAVLVQHDNTSRAKEIVQLRASGVPVYVFYTNYRKSKHGPLLPSFDFAFDENKTMVENTATATQALFGGEVSRENGLMPLPHLIHKKFPKRIAIHPMSTSDDKNWPKKKFLKLFKKLKERGYDPFFILGPTEKKGWPPSPLFPTLEDLATAIYESGALIGNDSGPAHLASYLQIPHLIIGRQERQMRLWRPGWMSGKILCPPKWLPNFKGLRLREEKWKYFITTFQVLKSFESII